MNTVCLQLEDKARENIFYLEITKSVTQTKVDNFYS